MSPQLALRILLVMFIVLLAFILVSYRTQEEFNAVTMKRLEMQIEMEKKIQEAEKIINEEVETVSVMERSEKLIIEDLGKYGYVTGDTAQEITRMINEQKKKKRSLNQ